MAKTRKNFYRIVLLVSIPLLAVAIRAWYVERPLDEVTPSSVNVLHSVTEGPWHEFISKEYGFKILVPVNPIERESITNAAKMQVVVHSFISETGSVAFGVSWTGFSKKVNFDKATPQQMKEALDTVRGSILTKTDKLLEEHPISYQSYVGREIEMLKLNGQARVKIRTYLIGSNSITISAVVPHLYNDKASMNRFLNSFQLIDK